MDDEEQRYQLLDSTNRTKEDAMYDAFGNKIYTTANTRIVKELGKFAVKKIIAKPMNYSTKTSKEEPVKLPPTHRSMAHSSPVHRSPALSKSKKITVKQPPAHSSPALSKSKKIAVKQPPAHSSPALSKSKKIAVKQPPAHSSPAKQPPAKLKPPALVQALATLGLPREDIHGPAAGGGAEKVHLYTIPARRPAPRPGISEDQHKTWHQKTSTYWQTAPPP
jgi:hypothetical protein